jgi:hypothetical protein
MKNNQTFTNCIAIVNFRNLSNPKLSQVHFSSVKNENLDVYSTYTAAYSADIICIE